MYGNSLEIIETIQFLKGEQQAEDLKEIILDLGANMIKLAGLGNSIEENKKKMLENIANGKAYQKFLQMVERQGGDITYLEDTTKFKKATYIENMVSNQQGIIKELPADVIAKYVCDLGAGRIKKEDSIDMDVGIVLNKKIGDKIEKGETILTIYSNKPIELPKGAVIIEDIK